MNYREVINIYGREKVSLKREKNELVMRVDKSIFLGFWYFLGLGVE